LLDGAVQRPEIYAAAEQRGAELAQSRSLLRTLLLHFGRPHQGLGRRILTTTKAVDLA
jgi:hypothetical protein